MRKVTVHLFDTVQPDCLSEHDIRFPRVIIPAAWQEMCWPMLLLAAWLSLLSQESMMSFLNCWTKLKRRVCRVFAVRVCTDRAKLPMLALKQKFPRKYPLYPPSNRHRESVYQPPNSLLATTIWPQFQPPTFIIQQNTRQKRFHMYGLYIQPNIQEGSEELPHLTCKINIRNDNFIQIIKISPSTYPYLLGQVGFEGPLNRAAFRIQVERGAPAPGLKVSGELPRALGRMNQHLLKACKQ